MHAAAHYYPHTTPPRVLQNILIELKRGRNVLSSKLCKKKNIVKDIF